MKYEFEWQYVDDPAVAASEPYIHFVFMLRFPGMPPGKNHVAHFCFNVLQEPETSETGISVVRRGFLVSVPFTKTDVTKFVEQVVAEAFLERPRKQALALLNTQFINSDIDFSHELVGDLAEADKLVTIIHEAFNGVERGDGITLHQAMVIAKYGSDQEFLAAKKRDRETRWQDVPDAHFAVADPLALIFLDPAGFRYYLPAAMSWSVRSSDNDDYENGFFTYLAVLPRVAPREVGRGIGAAFDLDSFIQEYSFTPAQVNAIYRFICFMAIRAEHGMDEDQYAAVKKWRQAALAGMGQ